MSLLVPLNMILLCSSKRGNQIVCVCPKCQKPSENTAFLLFEVWIHSLQCFLFNVRHCLSCWKWFYSTLHQKQKLVSRFSKLWKTFKKNWFCFLEPEIVHFSVAKCSSVLVPLKMILIAWNHGNPDQASGFSAKNTDFILLQFQFWQHLICTCHPLFAVLFFSALNSEFSSGYTYKNIYIYIYRNIYTTDMSIYIVSYYYKTYVAALRFLLERSVHMWMDSTWSKNGHLCMGCYESRLSINGWWLKGLTHHTWCLLCLYLLIVSMYKSCLHIFNLCKWYENIMIYDI